MRHYANGQWTEQDQSSWFDQVAYDAKDEYVLQENMSTEAHLGWGDEMVHLSLLTWQSWKNPRPEGAPEYLIQIDLHSAVEHVSAETLADAMDLLARWAPIVTAEQLTSWWDYKEAWQIMHDAEERARQQRRRSPRPT